MAVHSLARKWKEACCICGEFVSLYFTIVNPLSTIDYAKVCPEYSVSVNRICSCLVAHRFIWNDLFLDMLARFSSRLDVLLLGLSDALLHPIAILLHQWRLYTTVP